VQIGPPDLSYPLTCNAFSTILATSGILLYLGTMGESHTRFVPIKPRPSACPANGCCSSKPSPSQATTQSGI